MGGLFDHIPEDLPEEESGESVSTTFSGSDVFDPGLRSLLKDSTPDRALTAAVSRGRLASSLFFHGLEGGGMWGAAIALAAFLNCKGRDETSALSGACGKCRSCHQIFSFNFTDLHLSFPIPSPKKEEEEMAYRAEYLSSRQTEPFRIFRWERASGISIERARVVRRRLAQKGAPGIVRVVVFHEIEKTMPSAVDSLLKMIEEPPEETIFILTSSTPDAVAPTALSRCQRLRFPAFTQERIEEFLRERFDLSPATLSAAARLSQGSPGRASEIAEEMVSQRDTQSSEREVSWLAFKASLIESPAAALDMLQTTVDLRNRGSVGELLRRWESYLRDLALINQGKEEIVANVDFLPELERLAPVASVNPGLFELIDRFRDLTVNLRRNVHAPLALLDLAISLRKGLQPPGRP